MVLPFNCASVQPAAPPHGVRGFSINVVKTNVGEKGSIWKEPKPRPGVPKKSYLQTYQLAPQNGVKRLPSQSLF